MSEEFKLPWSEYSDCKDAGINNEAIPEELLVKYAENQPALDALEAAHKAGKSAIKKSRISKGRYAKKMRGGK